MKKMGSSSIDEALVKHDEFKQEQELCDWVKSKIEEIRQGSARVAHEAIWMQNIAAVLGFTGLQYNAVTKSLQPINRVGNASRRNRMQVNKLLPALQTRLAKLTKNPPKYDVRPNDMTQEAKDNARFKLDILNAKWDDLKINQKRYELMMFAEECGHAYLGINWDDSLGNLIEDPETGEVMFEGDIRIDVISPFEIFPDPLAKSFEEAKYLIRAKVRPLHYFIDQYGEKGAKVKEEEVWLQSAQFQSRINTMNTRGPSAGTQNQATKNSAIEMTYYERPSRKYPKGRMIITASGVLLKNDELPCGKFPLVKFDCVIIGGKYYSESLITHARPVQDQYNQIIRRRADWANKLLNGKYIYAKGSEVIREAFTDEQAEMVQYTPVPNAPDGGRPQAADIPTIPSYAYEEENRLREQFDEIMGLGDMDRGVLPAAGIPAIGMQLLLEGSEQRISPEIEQHEMAYAEIGALILDYVQAYYKTPRKIKFLGKNSYLVKDVEGKMLEGSNDVTVIKGSTVPNSKALRRQELINAYDRGLMGDPADPAVRSNLMRLLEFGDISEAYIDEAINQARADAVAKQVRQNIMPEIAECDPHQKILTELSRIRKTEEWDTFDEDKKELWAAVFEECLRLQGELTGALPPKLSPDEQAMAESDAEAEFAKEAPPPPPELSETPASDQLAAQTENMGAEI